MNVCVIGCGFIGTTLVRAMEPMDEVEAIYVTDKSREKAARLSSSKKVRYKKDLRDVLGEVDLVIEAASQQAVHQYAPEVLEAGVDILIMSVGALADDKLRDRCTELAKKGGCRIFIPAGALAGVDGLCAASTGKLDEVTLTSTKPAAAFRGNEYLEKKGIDLGALKKPEVMFEGSAREAVRLFPKTANVAATLSLAGVGFDRTRVKIIADPWGKRNVHHIIANGEFGELEVRVSNLPSPENPRTSVLAAMSAISSLKKITGVIWVGL